MLARFRRSEFSAVFPEKLGVAGDHGLCCRRFVLSRDVVPADLQQLAEHAKAVAHRIHLGAIVVRPLDRDLVHAQLILAREIEALGIESPALDALPWKYLLSRFTLEGFEAAL